MSFAKASSKREWVLTQRVFDRFLAILDTDRDQAGEKYEFIRLRLLKYFQWCGSDQPDIDADETLNRVMRRIDEGENVYNLDGYIQGVARLVQKESLKLRNRKQELDVDQVVELATAEPEEAQWRECLERCLGYLSDEEREIVTEYYKHEGIEKINCRKRLATRLGVSLNSLRVRMYRQRANLEACVQECLGREDF